MRYFVLALFLFLLSACAAPPDSPAATSLPPAAVEQTAPSATAPPAAAAPIVTDAVQSIQPVPQATSRGDKLVASDPASVQVGVGKPVLLEFFRFT